MKLKKFTIGFVTFLFLFAIIPSISIMQPAIDISSLSRASNTETFTGSISSGDDSIQHEFTVSSDVELIDISLEMPSGADYDLSLWDEAGQRTGGWTDADHSTKTQIDNSAYSGYSADPETISVEPPTSSGTWKVGCYSYSGSGTYTITVVLTTPEEDTTPPTISITSPADGATLNSADITLAWIGSDAGSGIDHYEISLDSGTMTNVGTSTSHEYTGLDDGEHSVMVMAYDGAGNSNSDGITFTIDTSGGPVIYTFSGSIAEKGETEKYEFNVLSGTSLIEISLEMPNTHDWDLSLWDDSNQRTGGWITGDGSQKTEIPNSVYSGWLTDPETISVEPPATIGTWKVAMFAYTGSGDYEIVVKVHGGSTVPDTTPPTISITSPSEGSTLTSSSVTVNWMGSDAESGINHYEVQLDSGSWSNVGTSTSHTFSGVANGAHDVNVRAYDNAGNSNTDTVSFTVDASSTGVKKWAVLVGISDYKAISDLSYCDEDATDWYNFLSGVTMEFDEILVYGDGHSSNYPKYDGIATEYNVKNALQYVVESADEDDIIMFATSGHGSGDGAGSSYLCQWDDNSGENGEDGELYDTELAAILEDAVAEKIFVFIDHCYSGGFGPELMAMANSQSVYCTTTCTDNGYGYDDPSHDNGAWTYYFLDHSWQSHFGGSATISLEEVFDYAHYDYPHTGKDEAEEYDGNPSQAFYLN